MSDRDEALTATGFDAPGTSGGEQSLQATLFEPLSQDREPKKPPLNPMRLGVAALATVTALMLFFLLTARSLEIAVNTETEASVEISGLAFPVGNRWLLRAGTYTVTVSAPGYTSWQETITVGDDASQRLEVSPAILPGLVTITSEPSGASVQLGDQLLGVTPTEILRLDAGDAQLRLTLPRYQPLAAPVSITGREVAQTLAFELQPNWADVAFTVGPATATLSVDDVAQPYTAGTPVQLLAGERRLALAAPGFQTTIRDLAVEAETPQNLGHIVLTPADGELRLSSIPSGANVSVNGEFQGRTPLPIVLAPGRDHRISLARPGYNRTSITVSLDQGSVSERKVTLTPRLGDVVFNIQPDNAELFVDGKPVGTGSQNRQLTAVEHRIEVKLDGYASYRGSILPREGLAQRLDVTLVTEAEARKAALKPELTSALGQTLLLIDPLSEPVNAFTLGAARRDPGRRSNETLRAVRLERAFYIATTETTNAQFRQFLASHDSGQIEGNSLNREHQPVVTISWQQAASFCNWLSRREGLPPFYREEAGIITGFTPESTGYRLPSEAEWAFVARIQGETTLRHAWGDSFPPEKAVTNVADNTSAFVTGRILNGYADGHIVSAPVGSYPANPRGLFDLGGNVAEWVHDVYIIPPPSTEEMVDPLGNLRGDNYTVRGGSWGLSRLSELRLTYRDYGAAGRDDLGFRVARYAE